MDVVVVRGHQAGAPLDPSPRAAAGDWHPQPDERVQVGRQKLAFGSRLLEFEDSSHLLQRPDQLAERLRSEGYALLRGVLDLDKVRKARSVVTECLHSDFNCIDSGKAQDFEAARIKEGCTGTLLTGYRRVCSHPDMMALVTSPELAGLFRRLFQDRQPASFENRWVRVFGTQEFTDEHTDYYRFASSAESLYTCWIPLGSYQINQGVLAVCPGTHEFIQPGQGEELPEEDSESECKDDQELPGEYLRKQNQLIWRSGSVSAGDLILFDIRLVHASTANLSPNFRMSVDTRWQPASCVPASDGYVFP